MFALCAEKGGALVSLADWDSLTRLTLLGRNAFNKIAAMAQAVGRTMLSMANQDSIFSLLSSLRGMELVSHHPNLLATGGKRTGVKRFVASVTASTRSRYTG
jgi:hypothetical protein